jgi:hypothetical protein
MELVCFWVLLVYVGFVVWGFPEVRVGVFTEGVLKRMDLSPYGIYLIITLKYL